MEGLSRFLNFRRAGAVVLAALSGLGVWVMVLQPAGAATVTVGSTSCTYSSFNGDVSGNFAFTCANTGTPQAGVLALNLTNTLLNLASGATTTLAVTRSGQTAGGGAATGNLSINGVGCLLSANAVTFADGSASPTPATVTVTAGSGTSCTIALTASGASLGIPSSTTITIGPQAGVLALNLTNTLSNLAVGATTTLAVTRTDQTADGGAATGTLAASGGCTVAPTAVTFANGSAAPAPATVTVTAGNTSGTTCSITLTAAGASLGTPNSTTIMVTNPGPAACTTTATHTIAWAGVGTLLNTVGQNQTGAVTMTPGSALAAGQILGNSSVVESTVGSPADIQFSISNCPGDFSKPDPCTYHSQYTGGAITFSIGPKPAGTPWYMQVCELPAGTTKVYFNMRQIRRPTPVPQDGPGTPSCTSGTCPVWVNFY